MRPPPAVMGYAVLKNRDRAKITNAITYRSIARRAAPLGIYRCPDLGILEHPRRPRGIDTTAPRADAMAPGSDRILRKWMPPGCARRLSRPASPVGPGRHVRRPPAVGNFPASYYHLHRDDALGQPETDFLYRDTEHSIRGIYFCRLTGRGWQTR